MTELHCPNEVSQALSDSDLACQATDKKRLTDDFAQNKYNGIYYGNLENETTKNEACHQLEGSCEKKRLLFLNPERATKYQKILQSFYDSDENEESDDYQRLEKAKEARGCDSNDNSCRVHDML